MVPGRMIDTGSGLFKRSASAVVMIPAALGIIYLGGLPFYAFLGIVWALLAHEWHGMPSRARGRIRDPDGRRLLACRALYVLYALVPALVYLLDRGVLAASASLAAFLVLPAATMLFLQMLMLVYGKHSPDERGLPVWILLGCLYSAPAILSLIFLREYHGPLMIFWLFAVVWGTDIGAYFTGRRLGGPKLAPRISPNKTWSGFFGGILWAVIAAAAVAALSGYSVGASLWGGVILSIVSQLGDLYESFIKRKLDVKDSGSIIPGHGGILDRVDGLLFAAPVMALAVYYGMLRL